MALPHIFANLPAGNTPASYLDDNFNALGATSIIPCTATGTNTIVLAAFANTPTVAAYNQLQSYRFVAANTTSGAATVQFAALAALPAYKASAGGPVAIGSGDIIQGECYDAIYDVALNTGTGGFHIFNVIPAGFTPVIDAYFYDEYVLNVDLAGTFPATDVAPLVAGGNALTSRAVTLTSASQKVGVFVDGYFGPASGQNVALSVFRGSTSIQTTGWEFGAAGGGPHVPIGTNVLDSPATTGSVTYSVRVGADSGALRANGTSTGRLYGGTSRVTQWTIVFHS